MVVMSPRALEFTVISDLLSSWSFILSAKTSSWQRGMKLKLKFGKEEESQGRAHSRHGIGKKGIQTSDVALAFHCLLTLNICPTFEKINVAFDDSQCYLRIKIALLQCSTLKSSAFAKLQTDATQVPANDLPSPISKGRFQNMWKSLGHVLFLQ